MDEVDPVLDLAARNFGIPYLYPYQRLVIANVLDAVDGPEEADTPDRQVVILPTGAGKSLCFQLPAAVCPGPTVVVYPLLGLMADQQRRLRSTGLGAVVLKGGMTSAERRAAFGEIRSGAARIVLVNPEILAARDVIDFIGGAGVFHFVVDEAHCIAEWGDSFRPAYLLLGDAIRSIGPRVVTAFTATASPPILGRIAEVLFGSAGYRLVEGSPDRPNIRYEVWPALSMRRALREAVAAMPGPMIVFAASRPGVQLLAEDLRASNRGLDVRFYHAGLDKAERAAVEDWFMDSADGVLCSTCAYGMGMDKKNVRTIIHYGAPRSVESYLQESGRAGRDGAEAVAILLRKADAGDYGAPGGYGAQVGPKGPDGTAKADGKAVFAAARAAAMDRYATGSCGCRRSYLLGALGAQDAEATACGACDRCNGSALEVAEGSDAIAALANRHARRFGKHAAAVFITGSAGTMAAPSGGVLGGWRVDEAEEAIEAAMATGLVTARTRWPWKGSLAPAPHRPGGSVGKLVLFDLVHGLRLGGRQFRSLAGGSPEPQRRPGPAAVPPRIGDVAHDQPEDDEGSERRERLPS